MQTPVITVITPTLGNPSLLKLKESLRAESVPYLHLVLWDNNRVANALKPEDIEDDRTFCYVMRHSYHQYPKQRNDIHLRALGVLMTNTPYVCFKDDDTWVENNHFRKVLGFMYSRKLDYTHVLRNMWYFCRESNTYNLIGVDRFESTGEPNKWGYCLIDNSSIYLKLEAARDLARNFLDFEIYGDDRQTKNFLDSKGAKGELYARVLVNHIAKPELIEFFKDNIIEVDSESSEKKCK